jgi:hypothetical protein
MKPHKAWLSVPADGRAKLQASACAAGTLGLLLLWTLGTATALPVLPAARFRVTLKGTVSSTAQAQLRAWRPKGVCRTGGWQNRPGRGAGNSLRVLRWPVG